MSTEKKRSCKPEIWGGVECTINRLGDSYRDQLLDTGHYIRQDDIRHFADLGIRRLRYPILWEKHAGTKESAADWTWISRQLEQLRHHKIAPIVGLVHHGSGPDHTDLLDPQFPEKLAAYAGDVAARFPWLEYYTPVNEPLTTARFSGLYGFWYPHHQDALSFARMLLHQLKATVLSMQAIRKVNPAAKLVQTEDLGKTHSTRLLAYQARFENERRWLTYDLLCGKLRPHNLMWRHLLDIGIDEDELNFFVDNPCPPDTLGFNYYLTSERYLDHDLSKYPPIIHGGNGKHAYADAEAVRTGKMEGPQVLLEEAWARYQLPLAITECHLNCTREEQMRWLQYVWDAARRACDKGVTIQAVTVWSLLGAYDWDSLLLQRNYRYETGVFDSRGANLRPTLMAHMIKSLSQQGSFCHPLLEQEGWWISEAFAQTPGKHPLIILKGNNDALADVFATVCTRRKIPYSLLHYQEVTTIGVAQTIIAERQPWAIVSTLPLVHKANQVVASASAACRIQVLMFSTIHTKTNNNARLDKVTAQNGLCEIPFAQQLMDEKMLLSIYPSSLIIRTVANRPAIKIKRHSAAKNADTEMICKGADTALDIFLDREHGVWEINDGQFWLGDNTAVTTEHARLFIQENVQDTD